MGMDDFQFLLRDLRTAFREDALWNNVIVPGRFYIDPLEVGLGDIEPGLGTTQTKFFVDRSDVAEPWPEVGDHLIIRGQDYEIVERDEDDLGEFAFRLIKQELGIRTVTSEGIYSSGAQPEPHPGPGRPTRRGEIIAAYEAAVAAGQVSSAQPLHEIVTTIRPRLGNGLGLSDRTLRKIVSGLVRDRDDAAAIR